MQYRKLIDASLMTVWVAFSLPAVAVDIGMSLPMATDWQVQKSSQAPQYTFEWENDAFLVGTVSDRFYTNGLKHSYEYYADDVFYLDNNGQLNGLGCENRSGRIHLNRCNYFDRALDAEDIDTRIFKVSKGLFISQSMYTPSDINWGPSQIEQYERPYAGWLQLGFSTTQSNTLGYEYFEWAIGCVGPCSNADVAQENIHRNLNDDLPRGWSTQIKNAMTLQGKYERALQVISFPWSERHLLEPYWVAEVGNMHVRSGLGMRLSFPIGHTREELVIDQRPCVETVDFNVENIHSPLSRSAFLSRQRQIKSKADKTLCKDTQYHITNGVRSNEMRFYLDMSGHLIAYNGLMQGPLHYDNRQQMLTTGHKPLLTTLSAGFQLKQERFALDFSYHTRSTESDGEALAFGEHSWLGLKVSTPDKYYLGLPISMGLLWGVSKSGL